MIENIFINVTYSRRGQRHVQLLKEYRALLGTLIPSLRADFPLFRPVDGGCSSYGVIFGLPSSLIEHMALKAMQQDAETRFSLEDVFSDESSSAKLAWVNGWRKLPHIPREVQRLFDYPQQFAEEIYWRIERELGRNASSQTGRLHIVSGDDQAPAIPQLPARYFVSSDAEIVAARRAEPYDQPQLLRERQEAHFLVSYQTPGGWLALKKELLTEVLCAGRDASIVGLPLDAAEVLRLMYPDLVSVPPSIETA
jgi:hypothetical protein